MDYKRAWKVRLIQIIVINIICGAFVGVAAGYISYYLYKYTVCKFHYFNADKGVMGNKQVLCIGAVYLLTFVYMIVL